jgi:hypothetical protein
LETRRTEDAKDAIKEDLVEVTGYSLNALLPLMDDSIMDAAVDDQEEKTMQTLRKKAKSKRGRKGKAATQGLDDDDDDDDDDQPRNPADERHSDRLGLLVSSASKCKARLGRLLVGPSTCNLSSRPTRAQRRTEATAQPPPRALYHVSMTLKDAEKTGAMQRFEARFPSKADRTRLLLTWAACLRFVGIQLPAKNLDNPSLAILYGKRQRFEVGFVFSESVYALNGSAGSYKVMFINPAMELLATFKKHPRHCLGPLLQYACHEVCHDVASHHDEHFASVFTELSACLARELICNSGVLKEIDQAVTKAMARLKGSDEVSSSTKSPTLDRSLELSLSASADESFQALDSEDEADDSSSEELDAVLSDDSDDEAAPARPSKASTSLESAKRSSSLMKRLLAKRAKREEDFVSNL